MDVFGSFKNSGALIWYIIHGNRVCDNGPFRITLRSAYVPQSYMEPFGQKAPPYGRKQDGQEDFS